MSDSYLEIFHLNKEFQLGLFGFGIMGALISGIFLRPLIKSIFTQLVSPKVSEIYQSVFAPKKDLIAVVISLGFGEFIATLLKLSPLIEITISLTFTIAATWLASQLIKQLFDVYLLNWIVQKGRKINDLLIIGKIISNISVVILAIAIFAQTHKVNILGLVASLGISGLAVAFAAQKLIEQVLGGIVLYLDKPFVIDDYIGLADGTFGRVESIGLRSTKIRSSGKGTLVIVPNNALTQMTIENFTGAKKVMALIYLNFQMVIQDEERALIRQVIVNSTSGIFGIDSRNTNVTFRNLKQSENSEKTQAQIAFFILGSGEVSMELRRQVLDIASQTITQKLKEYGVEFDIEEPTIYVDSPITI